MKFQSTLLPSGNATAVEVPTEVVEALGSGARPPVVVTINGYSWRTRIAAMRGTHLVGVSAGQRKACGIAEGEVVEVELALDTEPRVVAEPAELASALDQNERARTAFDKLPFGLKRKHVTSIQEAKSSEVKQRRIAKLVAELGDEV